MELERTLTVDEELKNSDNILPLNNNKHLTWKIIKTNLNYGNNTESNLKCLTDLVRYIYNKEEKRY